MKNKTMNKTNKKSVCHLNYIFLILLNFMKFLFYIKYLMKKKFKKKKKKYESINLILYVSIQILYRAFHEKGTPSYLGAQG